MNYWLMKTEPDCYSIDDLKRQKVGTWDGVRNFQARNFIKEMKVGDQVFIYHSSAKTIGIVGLAEVARDAYPDKTAFDKKAEHFDPKSKKDKPTWFVVDLKFVKKFESCFELSDIKKVPSLHTMKILQKGSRLSVTPVSKKEFDTIIKIQK